jgi:hypothetical protein
MLNLVEPARDAESDGAAGTEAEIGCDTNAVTNAHAEAEIKAESGAETEADTELGAESQDGATIEVPLIRLALARSGDKGDTSNIAIIARHPDYVPFLRREVTARRMADHFRGLVAGPVERFEAPGLHAFNFLMQEALGGGGMASLRIDPQGKAYGPMALEMMVSVPFDLLRRVERG